MALKRYSVEELTSIVEEIAMNELANGHQVMFNNKVIVEDKEKTTLELFRTAYLDRIKSIKERIEMFSELAKEETESSIVSKLNKTVELLQEELTKEENKNLKMCKEIYERESNPLGVATVLEFSLNKKINALYDDFNARIVFLDDITGLGSGSNFDDLCKITDKEERIKFVKEHIEVTHLCLVITSANNVVWKLKGKFNKDDSDITSSSCSVLPSRFLDFGELRMADTMDIANNDIRQIVQTKVDIDQEGFKVIAQRIVRGDDYQILDGRESGMLIRYVCPSTGRVYFNPIETRNLEASKYYKKSDYESYINAWWNITHLGANPLEEQDVVRC